MNFSQSEIEKLFIGSIIADSNNLIYAIDIVSDEDLTHKSAVVSYRVMLDMFKAKKKINLQTFLLEPQLADHFTWLVEADDVGEKTTCTMYAEDIAEKAKRRRLTSGITKLSKTPVTDSRDTLSDLKKLYSSEVTGGNESGDMKTCFNILDEQVEKNMQTGSLGFETGFDIWANLDVTYEAGHCWAYGGESSVGKTSLMIEQILRVLAVYKNPPKMAIHSTEMKSYQLVARLLAGITGIPHKLILRGKQDHSIEQAKKVLFKSGLKIYDVNRDFSTMFNQCRKDKMQGGLDLVWLDYIQNFKMSGLKGYEAMSSMGKDCLALPQELDLTLFVLAQMAKDDIQNDKGGLFFKGGGELSESCDLGFKLMKSKKKDGCIFVEHGKNRHGGKRDFFLEFAPYSNRLNEI